MSTISTTHPVTPEELMALLDGELAAERAQSVSAHCESCADCQHTFASLLRTSHSLNAWVVEPPSPLLERLATLANSEGAAKPAYRHGSLKSLLQTRAIGWGLGLAAGFLVLVAIATPNLLRSRLAANEASSLGSLRKINAPALAGPAADSNGLANRRGEKAQDSFSINGRAVLDQSRDFSGPMIARTVSLAILVKDFDAARKSLDSILVRYNGYAAALAVSTPQGTARSLQGSLRIPAPQLSSALVKLKSLGRVENEAQNGEEVTQQHADLVARLKNSRETEQRLQAILTQRTGKISDVLSVEREIARVRGEIEQMEAEQKNLEHRVDFATVDLHIDEEFKAQLHPPTPSFSTQFHNAAVLGLRNVADSLVALLLMLAEYGPILLFWALVLLAPAWLIWQRWRHVGAHA